MPCREQNPGRRVRSLVQCSATFLPTAHPTLTMAPEGTPQNFASRKGGTKQYVAKNADPVCKFKVTLIKIN
jgi:hypothetical protein